MENRLVSVMDFQLDHDSFGRLVLTLPDGQRHVGVRPVRGFPLSDPQYGLAICDGEGRELVWIDDLAALPLATRGLIEAELAQREFLPHILRIYRVSLEVDPCQWEVETDRGRTTFVLKSDEDVRRLDDRRAIVIDAHGTRYLIQDTAMLDRASRRILERYL